MAVELEAVTFESPDPHRDASFWAAILGRTIESDAEGLLLVGSGGQVGIRFVDGAAHGAARNRLHLHLADGPRTQRATIEACTEFGARLLGNGHVPPNSYAVMEDAVGDEFCVIEDGNAYLAGCGPLGEVTCEGTSAVGRFWSRALGWPLVWEDDEETAIQSPDGGTKIAWSGLAVEPEAAPDRQYFVLTVSDVDFEEELARLVALGATVDPGESSVPALRDPGGNRFVVRVV